MSCIPLCVVNYLSIYLTVLRICFPWICSLSYTHSSILTSLGHLFRFALLFFGTLTLFLVVVISVRGSWTLTLCHHYCSRRSFNVLSIYPDNTPRTNHTILLSIVNLFALAIKMSPSVLLNTSEVAPWLRHDIGSIAHSLPITPCVRVPRS